MSRRNRDRRVQNQLARAVTTKGDRPSFVDETPLVLREIPTTKLEADRRLVNSNNNYVRAYMLGECSIIVTREFGQWHLSIAHPSRDPIWREIAEARYRLLPGDITVAMLLPPLKYYVNQHRFCFQMQEIPALAQSSVTTAKEENDTYQPDQ